MLDPSEITSHSRMDYEADSPGACDTNSVDHPGLAEEPAMPQIKW
jgi:hypothetical protein